MARPQSNGLIEINSSKSDDSGFGCMKLIEYMTQEGITDWNEWHYRNNRAAHGECLYKDKCPIYARTANKDSQKKERR